jgi:hypothetical protein
MASACSTDRNSIIETSAAIPPRAASGRSRKTSGSIRTSGTRRSTGSGRDIPGSRSPAPAWPCTGRVSATRSITGGRRVATCGRRCRRAAAQELRCTAPRVRGDTRPADRRVTLRGAFRDGTPAAANGLEIMPAFDAAGALTKSSTLDGAPREPLVYGACRPVAAGRDKARYLFFTAAPAADWGAAAGANALQAKR